MTTTLKLERIENGWRFWLLWVLASAIGWAVGLTAANLTQLALEAASGGVVVEAEGGAVLEGAGNLLFGLAVGTAQWLVLRRQIEGAIWWAPATAGGFALAGIVGGALQDAGAAVGGLVISLGLGVAAGTLQWLLLRRQVKRAGWWVLGSTVLVFGGLITGLVLSFVLTGAAPDVSGSGIVFAAVGGAAFGITSGFILMWLLRQPALERI
jgi:hypothetical protein